MHLRCALIQVFETLRKHPRNREQVEELFQKLEKGFPEISGKSREEAIEIKLGELQLQEPPQPQAVGTTTTGTTTAASASAEKKTRIKKSKEEVKNILIASIKNIDAWKDYTDIPMKTDTEQDCIKTLHLLKKAIIDAKKRIIFFSALQGEVLYKLKETSKCSMNDLMKKTEYSQTHIYLLINMYKLIVNNNKLRHSDLPLSFFHYNMQTIKQICDEEGLFK